MLKIEKLIVELEELVNQARFSPEYPLLLKSIPVLTGKTIFDALTSVPDIIIIEYPTLYQVKKSLKEKFKNETENYKQLQGTDLEKIISFLDLKKENPADVGTVYIQDKSKDIDKQLRLFEEITELIPDKYKKNIGSIDLYLLEGIISPYASYDKDKKAINLSLNSDDTTFVSELAHEYGHLLEEFNEAIKKESWRFINKRIIDENKVKISDIYFDQDEEYDLDKYPELDVYKGFFISPYVGRTYGEKEIGQTEIISLGLQSLFLNPITFLFKDIGHFEIIYHLLKGKL